METLCLQSQDLLKKNIEAIVAAFPSVVTEMRDEQGNIRRAVDFELLKQELSDQLVEGDKERYQLIWPGKRQAILQANAPINKTLRPVRADSVDWDTTQNIYIEGDNLEALKLLQESYLNKVKCIYIDPPYNTGKDFIYKDDFRQNTAEYLQESGQVDAEGNRFFQNNESNGRFHSDWLTMMYPRLKLARNLLKDDGVIFINIDDDELDNLRKICDEIFGRSNFLGTIIWKKKTNGNNMGHIPPVHDYILSYAKAENMIEELGYPVSLADVEKTFSNPDNDPRGSWTTTDLSANHAGPYFPVVNPLTNETHFPPPGRYWVFNEDEVKKRILDGRIIFGKSGTAKPVQKVFLKDKKIVRQKTDSWWDKHGMNEDGTTELAQLFNVPKIFSHSKPSMLIRKLVNLTTTSRDVVLDFFSGSATTAHAIMQLNAEDACSRKYILVQIPENLDESLLKADSNTKAVVEKAIEFLENNGKPHYLTEIGKERIRRAAKKIQEETNADIDYGFRVFRVDTGNMKDVYHSPQELHQDMFSDLTDNIKADRSGEDLLIQVMLACGLPLSLPMQTKEVLGQPVYYVAENSLVACFAEEVPEELVRLIAQDKPLRVVFRDSSFASDAARINVEEIFKALSPATEIKVL